MNPYEFGPIAAVLDAAYGVVMSLSSLLTPFAGTASAALAVVLVTLAVRALLIPVGVSQVKAANARKRIAPQLAALQKKHGKDREALQKKTLELYQREKVSPTAGCLPMLLQIPVVSTIYGLFIIATVNGHPNELLTESLLGMPLGKSFASLVTTGTLDLATGAMAAGIVVVIAVVAQLSRMLLAEPLPGTPGGPPAATPTPGVPDLSGMMKTLSFLPFMTAIIALFVPLAAALYLVVTTVWTFCERSILKRMLPPAEAGRTGTAAVPA
ncbi:YidC/Oxa1 family membrane protein insertase [Labedella endophytica]|uniref:Membrane protein insertase YidC n=1 Tax=Labedella endophytica TaxID=1523160 RepID=A0A3S0XKU0_9MICO|nr:membrane protein insertase YidC [Labedella endophytica]RUQ98302.1 membrane protein insertase YidC [Labedella endophytica]